MCYVVVIVASFDLLQLYFKKYWISVNPKCFDWQIEELQGELKDLKEEEKKRQKK